MGWRRRRRKRRRRRRPWSRPARAHWRARRRRSRGAAETTTKRTRRASSTLSSSFCPDLYRTCSRSKNKTKRIKRTLDAGSSLAWARLRGKGRRGSLRWGLFGWKGLSKVLQVWGGARSRGGIGLGICRFGVCRCWIWEGGGSCQTVRGYTLPF